MLEDHEFCDNCPGCRPAILDMRTRRPLGPDTPEMKAVNEVWDKDTTYAQRRAYIEVTLHNSRQPGELRLAEQVMAKIQQAWDHQEHLKKYHDAKKSKKPIVYVAREEFVRRLVESGMTADEAEQQATFAEHLGSIVEIGDEWVGIKK